MEISDILNKAFESGGSGPMIAIVLVIAVAATLLKDFLRPKRKRWTRTSPKAEPASGDYVNLRDPKVQMQAIAQAEFDLKPLLNKEEYRLLPILEAIAKDLGPEYRLIIQTTLGELLKARAGTSELQRQAAASINSKRLDFAIVDSAGILKLAIEYQGSGHYQGQAFMRDAVKREALRRAGVHMLEVRKDFTAQQVKAEVLTHFPVLTQPKIAPQRLRKQRLSG